MNRFPNHAKAGHVSEAENPNHNAQYELSFHSQPKGEMQKVFYEKMNTDQDRYL